MRTCRSALAGTWYPANPEELQRTVDTFLNAAEPAVEGTPLGLIVPHAGYAYSGAVAGAGYRLLRAAPPERVVILAPSHRMAYRGAAILDVEEFETPLGPVVVDPVSPSLTHHPSIRIDPRPFDDEHSLEIQLPLLQRAAPGARVVPLLFGDLSAADYPVISTALASLADERTVFVVSSDFTHYGWRFGYQPFPADNAAAVRAHLRDLDMGAVAPVLEGDASAFARYIERTGDTVCGRVPIRAFLTWIDRRHHGTLVAYRTSLDVTGDYEHCVSYAAIAFGRGAAPRCRPPAGTL